MGTIPFAGSPTGQPNSNPFQGRFDTGGFDFGTLFNKFSPKVGGQNNGPLNSTIPGTNFGDFKTSPLFQGSSLNGPFGTPSPGSIFPAFSAPNMLPGSSGFSTSNFPGLPQVSGHDLDKIYGKGVGEALSQFLNSGAGFNPQVIQALINQAQPFKAQQEAKMMDIYGNMGSAYSSTASIGLNSFDAQFDAALEGQIANLYQESVQNYLNVLMGVKQDAKENNAQEFGLSDIFKLGTEIVGGIFGV